MEAGAVLAEAAAPSSKQAVAVAAFAISPQAALETAHVCSAVLRLAELPFSSRACGAPPAQRVDVPVDTFVVSAPGSCSPSCAGWNRCVLDAIEESH